MTDRATVEKSMRAMQQNFQADKASGLQATYGLQLADGGGAWGVVIADGRCELSEGMPSRTDTTITMKWPYFLRLAQGRLDVVGAFKQGQIQVAGNLQLAQKFPQLFPPWLSFEPVGSPPPDQITNPPPAEREADDSTAAGAVNAQLLNGSFDDYQPFVYEGDTKVWKENQFPEEYGQHWTLDIISRGKGRPHLMNSETFGRFTQKYFAGGGRDYHIEGRHSQVITSRYQFDILLRQTVAAQPGRNYKFSGAMVSFYKGTGSRAQHDKIFMNIGLDPSGGSDYNSSPVVWSGRDGRNNEWRYPTVSAEAQANQITVFIRLENCEDDVGNTELNIIHLDSFKLES